MSLYRPEIFQGFGKKHSYFEGWYFKSVDLMGENTIVAIPGIAYSKTGEDSHAFIQFIDYKGNKAYYFRFGLSEFWADPRKFEIKIGRSFFSLNRMQLDIDQDGVKVQADLKFTHIHPWPVSLLSPGAMGWYGFTPFMECYHGVLSFDHDIEGKVGIDGRDIDMARGKGYMEKDWGTSMPSSWIWFQTNHFREDGISLFGSVAKIPWMGSYFTGFIIGLFLRGKVYKFATYTGARVDRLLVNDTQISMLLEDKKYLLEIKALRADGVELPAPVFGGMTRKIGETTNAKIDISFYKKDSRAKDGKTEVFSGTGSSAGLEFVGDIGELLEGFKK